MKFNLILILAIFTISSFGQGIIEQENSTPYIEVTGTAEQEIIPDQIYIRITITEDYKGKTKITIEEQEEQLKDALKEIGIDLANLSLSDANADYVKIRWSKKDILTKRDYTLLVSNAKMVVNVYQELEKLKIDEAHIVKVNHSKIDSIRRTVRISAIKAAKEKSDYLLAAIGEETGKPLIITETANPVFSNVNQTIRGARSNSEHQYIDGNKFKNEIQFQKIKLQTTIYVKFSIKE